MRDDRSPAPTADPPTVAAGGADVSPRPDDPTAPMPTTPEPAGPAPAGPDVLVPGPARPTPRPRPRPAPQPDHLTSPIPPAPGSAERAGAPGPRGERPGPPTPGTRPEDRPDRRDERGAAGRPAPPAGGPHADVPRPGERPDRANSLRREELPRHEDSVRHEEAPRRDDRPARGGPAGPPGAMPEDPARAGHRDERPARPGGAAGRPGAPGPPGGPPGPPAAQGSRSAYAGPGAPPAGPGAPPVGPGAPQTGRPGPDPHGPARPGPQRHSGPPPGRGPVPPPRGRPEALSTTPLVRGADLPPVAAPPAAGPPVAAPPAVGPPVAAPPAAGPSGAAPPGSRPPGAGPSGNETVRFDPAADPRARAEPVPPWNDARRPRRSGWGEARPAAAGVQPYPWLGDSPTELIAAIRDDDDSTQLLDRPSATGKADGPSLARSSSLIAIASLVSRVTGFLRQIALVAVLGLALVNSSYTVANTLPNIVYELLLGGVLSSVMIPLLVRAQRDDPDGGVAYTRKLLTIAGVALLGATLLAMVAAGPLVALYLGGETTSTANPELATAFAYLLLPQIFFYGIGALFGAVLNSKGVFGPFAWAPVLNNVIVLVVLVVYWKVPGEISLDPVRMGDAKLLVLGIGTTLGIVAQALILLPALRRVGVSFRPLWGWDPRLRSAGGLALWVIGYVLIGQFGYIVTTRVASGSDAGAVSIYSNTWLLLQVPYGVLGVSLLTALMPRMSKAAADGRIDDVVKDLSLGSRLSAVFLVPISVLLTIFGPAVGVALFSIGKGGADGGAARLGAAVAVSAFGLLPYAVTLLQLRVFYALTDSRTPTMIQGVIVVVKIPMLLLCPVLLAPRDVVLGLAAANGLSFVVGAVVGQCLLARRLGHVRTREVLVTVATTLLSALVGAIVAYALTVWIGSLFGGWGGAGGAWAQLVVALVVATPVMLVMMWLLRVRELEPVWRRLPPRLRR